MTSAVRKRITPAKNRPDKAVMDHLITYLKTWHPIGRETVSFVRQQSSEVHIKKGDILQRSGTICQSIYFVVKGILRGYVVDNRKKVTTWITSENQLISSIRGFLMQQPTAENIEALEDCHLLAFHYSDLQHLYDHYPEFNILGRKIAEYYYVYAEDRAFICRISNASVRYNYFIAGNGHLVNRIPLMYIASYLGISIETLSRIRKKLTHKPAKTTPKNRVII